MELQSGPALNDQVGAGSGSVFCKRSAEKADRASNFVGLIGPLGSLAIGGWGAW